MANAAHEFEDITLRIAMALEEIPAGEARDVLVQVNVLGALVCRAAELIGQHQHAAGQDLVAMGAAWYMGKCAEALQDPLVREVFARGVMRMNGANVSVVPDAVVAAPASPAPNNALSAEELEALGIAPPPRDPEPTAAALGPIARRLAPTHLLVSYWNVPRHCTFADEACSRRAGVVRLGITRGEVTRHDLVGLCRQHAEREVDELSTSGLGVDNDFVLPDPTSDP